MMLITEHPFEFECQQKCKEYYWNAEKRKVTVCMLQLPKLCFLMNVFYAHQRISPWYTNIFFGVFCN